MKRSLVLIGCLVAVEVAVNAANKVDPRLGTAKKAYVMPVSENDDNRQVAACFAEHLPTTTPLEMVAAKGDADVVFTVTKAHVPSAG